MGGRLTVIQGGVHFCKEQTLLYPAGSGVARVLVDNTGHGGVQEVSKGGYWTAPTRRSIRTGDERGICLHFLCMYVCLSL